MSPTRFCAWLLVNQQLVNFIFKNLFDSLNPTKVDVGYRLKPNILSSTFCVVAGFDDELRWCNSEGSTNLWEFVKDIRWLSNLLTRCQVEESYIFSSWNLVTSWSIDPLEFLRFIRKRISKHLGTRFPSQRFILYGIRFVESVSFALSHRFPGRFVRTTHRVL